MGLEVQTAPATDPVTTAECKTHSRISTSSDDSLIALYITTARKYAEDVLNRTLVTTTYDLTMDGFRDRHWSDGWIVHLPRPPAASITSITYLDSAGDSQTWTSSLYRLDITSLPGRVTPAWGEAYPDTRGVIGDVTIRYVAGYGAASAVPEQLKTAIKQLVGSMYDMLREAHGMGAQVTDLPFAGDMLMATERVMTF